MCVKPRTFAVEQQILLLLSSSSSKLLVQRQGPYKAMEQVVETNYCIRVPSQRVRLYHVNLLKVLQEPEDRRWYHANIDWDKEGRQQPQELQRQVATELPASEWQL